MTEELDFIKGGFEQFIATPEGNPTNGNPNHRILLMPLNTDLNNFADPLRGEEENGGGAGGDDGKRGKVGRVSASGTSYSVFVSTPQRFDYRENYEAKFPPLLRADICLHFDDINQARQWVSVEDGLGSLIARAYEYVLIIADSNPIFPLKLRKAM
jgi:hypothetical protein